MTFKNEIVKENIIVDNLGFPLMKLTAAFMSCVHSVTKGCASISNYLVLNISIK